MYKRVQTFLINIQRVKTFLLLLFFIPPPRCGLFQHSMCISFVKSLKACFIIKKHIIYVMFMYLLSCPYCWLAGCLPPHSTRTTATVRSLYVSWGKTKTICSFHSYFKRWHNLICYVRLSCRFNRPLKIHSHTHTHVGKS